jgi:indole-3-acetate monooxygenase
MNDIPLQSAPPRGHENEIESVTQEISVMARDLATETERRRRLPERLVAAMHDSGLPRAGAPREVEGLELPPGIALRCADEVARGDASAGWCLSIAITSSLLAAYLPDGARQDLFGGRGVAAGVWAPRGKALSVDGGVSVSGRWAFCSGITHADLMFAAA